MFMFDVNDDANGGFRRIEIPTGRNRGRRRSVVGKAQIVEETLVPERACLKWHVAGRCVRNRSSRGGAARCDSAEMPCATDGIYGNGLCVD
jgi:hypothetical protein